MKFYLILSYVIVHHHDQLITSLIHVIRNAILSYYGTWTLGLDDANRFVAQSLQNKMTL